MITQKLISLSSHSYCNSLSSSSFYKSCSLDRSYTSCTSVSSDSSCSGAPAAQWAAKRRPIPIYCGYHG